MVRPTCSLGQSTFFRNSTCTRICLSVRFPHTHPTTPCPFRSPPFSSSLPLSLSAVDDRCSVPAYLLSVHSAAAVTLTTFDERSPSAAHSVVGRRGTLLCGHAGQGRPGCAIWGPMTAAAKNPMGKSRPHKIVN